MGWGRGVPLPDGVRTALRLGRGEKVLAAAALEDGAWVVGTHGRLVVAGKAGELRVDRPWSDVDTAAWDGDTGRLTVVWMAGVPSVLTLTDAGQVRLPMLVRERVESSVIARQLVSVRGHGGARLVVRRVDERLVVQTAFDPGTDPADPAVAEAVSRGKAELADRVGALSDR